MTREEVKEQKQRIAEYRMLEQEIFWNNKRIEELGSIPFTEVLPFLNKHRKRFMKCCTSREIDKVREIMLNQLRMITALQIRMITALQKSIRGIMTRQEQIKQEAINYAHRQDDDLVYGESEAFIAGAMWADRTMIERACEYYQHELQQVASIMGRLRKGGGELIKIKESVEQFKKAMEQ